MKFGIRKLESWGYQMVIQYRLVTDRHNVVAKTSASIPSRE